MPKKKDLCNICVGFFHINNRSRAIMKSLLKIMAGVVAGIYVYQYIRKYTEEN